MHGMAGKRLPQLVTGFAPELCVFPDPGRCCFQSMFAKLDGQLADTISHIPNILNASGQITNTRTIASLGLLKLHWHFSA